ncbi:hypothetical protein V8G54_027542 [Vigna mungo]|uniref:Uncharacterized protein n=1 Tax=Vigna mungo TaxID=3915 RepID=A0AAQ3RQJ5_VIGMU
MARDNVLTRVATGAAVGGAIGGAVGAVYGTYDAIRYKIVGNRDGFSHSTTFPSLTSSVPLTFSRALSKKLNGYQFLLWLQQIVPGFLKIRHIGQTTLGSAAVFSLFLAAGTLIRSH